MGSYRVCIMVTGNTCSYSTPVNKRELACVFFSFNSFLFIDQ